MWWSSLCRLFSFKGGESCLSRATIVKAQLPTCEHSRKHRSDMSSPGRRMSDELLLTTALGCDHSAWIALIRFAAEVAI